MEKLIGAIAIVVLGAVYAVALLVWATLRGLAAGIWGVWQMRRASRRTSVRPVGYPPRHRTSPTRGVRK